jgi:hypothetical protein
MKLRLYKNDKRIEYLSKNVIIKSGNITIKDPIAPSFIVKTKLPKGKYVPFVNPVQIPKFGHRLMSILLIHIHKKYDDKLIFHLKKIGKVGIDSALVSVSDSSKKLDKNKIEKLMDRKMFTFINNSLILHSGLGDGVYNIYSVSKPKYGIVGILIDFYGIYARKKLRLKNPLLVN